ncbi:glycoside hydrolase family 125 protein [Actinomycetaceae bacterium MB13-C1-2]|nr:glycoside hydrolase family 125 protein [Actinomycetaceae bacterium MB13-C1-2]
MNEHEEVLPSIDSEIFELSQLVSARYSTNPLVARVFQNCLAYSWSSAISVSKESAPGAPEIFVRTGDIPAMWLRDSVAQMRPYLPLARHPKVREVLTGVLRRQQRCIQIDPYANAFNDGPTGATGETSDVPAPGSWVWERKFELDSICAPLQFGYAIWRASDSTEHLDAEFRTMAETILQLMELEQDHAASNYQFLRLYGPFSTDSLPCDGKGDPTAKTGMIWSGFRPSDDRCEFGYHIPANAMAVASLGGLAQIASEVWNDEAFAQRVLRIAQRVHRGILDHGLLERDDRTILAYEVDGLGGALFADDANLPSLLGLPLTGWLGQTDPIYESTRRWVLSPDNPYYYQGTSASGVGSAHTPPGYIWPIAIATQGLTGTEDELSQAITTLTETTGGTEYMHESFDPNNPKSYTRPWFGWANAMYAELVMKSVGIEIAEYFPKWSGN